MSKTKYKKVIGIVVCVIYLFYSVMPYIEIKSDASTALDTYAPSVSIGQPLPQGFSILDISNFLSHVLDSAAVGVKKNLGYIWNRIVDSGYCPGNLQSHRHNFIYGLTSSSLSLDFEQPREGYYCYCEYCGQLAGKLIEEYILENNINSEGDIVLYPSYCGLAYNNKDVGFTAWAVETLYPYGINFTENIESLGSLSVEYGVDNLVTYYTRERGYLSAVFAFNIKGIDYESITKYSNITKHRFQNNNNTDVTQNYNAPYVFEPTEIYINQDLGMLISIFPHEGERGNVWRRETFNYINNYIMYLNLGLTEEALNDNYNYDNIQAPIAYVNNGTLIYGGYSSNIVNTDMMVYTDPLTGTEYDIEDLEYDYSTNTYTLDISDFLNGVTVEFGVDGIRIDENGQEKQYYYVTNPLTPVNPVTDVGASSGLVNLDGTINLTVNQVSSNTNAYITTNEDIPQGLRILRETLATMFVELPEMTGDFTEFMETGFSYIPDEVMTLVVFGVSVAVFVGIFKLFWR